MPSERRVTVWRSDLLPSSETFIRNQVHSYRQFHAEYMGISRLPGTRPLERPVTVAATDMHAPAARVARVLGRSPTLERRLRTHRPDLLHAHFGPDATVAAAFARHARLPLVATFHGYDVTSYPRDPSRAARRYRRRIERLFTDAAALVAVSEFVASRLDALGAPASKVHVLPIGIPVRSAPPLLEPRGGVLFVGRLVEKKGVADLLDAVARLGRRVPVVIIGDGPLRAPLERRAAELGVDAEFQGAGTPDEVAAAMARAAVFCAPSRTAPSGDAEGLGMVFLEAAAMVLPVLAYRHGGVEEAVVDGRTGLLVDEGDVPALSAALGTLLDRPALREELGVRGRERVLRHFDVEARTAALEELYLTISR